MAFLMCPLKVRGICRRVLDTLLTSRTHFHLLEPHSFRAGRQKFSYMVSGSILVLRGDGDSSLVSNFPTLTRYSPRQFHKPLWRPDFRCLKFYWRYRVVPRGSYGAFQSQRQATTDVVQLLCLVDIFVHILHFVDLCWSTEYLIADPHSLFYPGRSSLLRSSSVSRTQFHILIQT